ncbi:MAG: hypothetical protein Phog2KO_20280 [Phototrophicaceae bacterium]
MSVTLIMTWDIKEDMEQEYFQFVVREWVPATSRLGLQPVAAWYTQWRIDETVPMIRAEAIADDADTIHDILKDPDWHSIQAQLMEYVENYSHKVVETTGEFRM